MIAKKLIAILTGGTSSERGVALLSAKNVLNVLKTKYNVYVFDIPLDLPKFLRQYKKFAVAIPIFHGVGGEDGIIQGFLKTLGMPFLFSDVNAHALGINKLTCKLLAQTLNIPTANFSVLERAGAVTYKHPVVIKPMFGGSSIGISIALSQIQLNKAINDARRYDNALLLEDYISGHEYTVAVVEKFGQTVALPVIAIISKHNFFDYKSKYDAKLAQEICPAPISKVLAQRLQTAALTMHQAIGARHMSRSDFIVARNQTYFLEINTIPGLTKNSLMLKATKAANIDMLTLFSGWINSLKR